MKKAASKSDAIALIKAAKAAGFTSTVEGLRSSPNGRPFAVMVSLSGAVAKGMLFASAHVNVSFRRHESTIVRSRPSVAITSRCDWERQKNSRRGLWSAQRAIEYLKKTASDANTSIVR